MHTVRKSVLFENSDTSLDFGPQGISGGSFGTQETYNYSQSNNQHDPSNSVMDFIGGSDLVGGVAGDYLLRKGMEGIYGRMDQYQSYFDVLRIYFDVDNAYVLHKIFLLLFPFRHKKWSRAKHDTFPSNDTNRDINDPDLYLPIMTFISFFLMVGGIMGQKGEFHADTLSRFAFWKILFWIAEAMILRLGFYFFGLDRVSVLDSIAYTGYKFLGILIIVAVSLFGGAYTYWPLWLYSSVCMAYFLVRSLRRAALHTDDAAMRIKMDSNVRMRNWFLFFVCFLQLPLMFFLSFWSAEKIFFV